MTVQMFGVDVIFDNMKPTILEINKGPDIDRKMIR